MKETTERRKNRWRPTKEVDEKGNFVSYRVVSFIIIIQFINTVFALFYNYRLELVAL